MNFFLSWHFKFSTMVAFDRNRQNSTMLVVFLLQTTIPFFFSIPQLAPVIVHFCFPNIKPKNIYMYLYKYANLPSNFLIYYSCVLYFSVYGGLQILSFTIFASKMNIPRGKVQTLTLMSVFILVLKNSCNQTTCGSLINIVFFTLRNHVTDGKN